MKERRSRCKNPASAVMRWKLVLVGDVQCGKTAMLQVLAKDSYPETYVPTVFENYTASVDLEGHRVELSLWDTSGSPYYDNVRPLCYSDSDAALVCFDVSRPETLDSAIKKWKTEIRDYCPTTRILLVGCKTDLRTDYSTVLELSNQKQAPISNEQGLVSAKLMGAQAYLECSAFTSEKSVHSTFRAASLSCLNRPPSEDKGEQAGRFSKRLKNLPSGPETTVTPRTFPKEKARNCSIM